MPGGSHRSHRLRSGTSGYGGRPIGHRVLQARLHGAVDERVLESQVAEIVAICQCAPGRCAVATPGGIPVSGRVPI
ncbi:hypothetical protein BVI2075_180139 [Burkholderia vietnamiensis]|nr:hypothetical protein BVI2075_180139 [Burkholderia vietnamiensis]CAG9225125.1 hypothetical protein BVI1335_530119 [Burkholderia vietnamiensis]